MSQQPHDRIFNFNAGPSTLPVPVLEELKEELLNYRRTGMSAMELSHRSPEYSAIHEEAIADVKELMGLGDEHHVLFLQGGASHQFAMIPLNLLGPDVVADYVVTGTWSQKALKEAAQIGNARVAASSEEGGFTRIPGQDEWNLSDGSAYTHITSNNTIKGTQFHSFPEGGAPLVGDMSSDILSRGFDPSPFGLIYAGAQKNLGPAGTTLVVLREDLLARCREDLPIILRYKTHVDKNSLYNTAPTLSIYIVGKVLKWIKGLGGLEAMEKRNQEKAEALYGYLEEHADFYRCPVESDSRSWMNVVFRLPNEELEAKFVAEGKQRGLGGLKGHRSVGGIRVSMYNAMPLEGVQEVLSHMEDFRNSHT